MKKRRIARSQDRRSLLLLHLGVDPDPPDLKNVLMRRPPSELGTLYRIVTGYPCQPPSQNAVAELLDMYHHPRAQGPTEKRWMAYLEYRQALEELLGRKPHLESLIGAKGQLVAFYRKHIGHTPPKMGELRNEIFETYQSFLYHSPTQRRNQERAGLAKHAHEYHHGQTVETFYMRKEIDVPQDILGLILGFLPSIHSRITLSYVSRNFRYANFRTWRGPIHITPKNIQTIPITLLHYAHHVILDGRLAVFRKNEIEQLRRDIGNNTIDTLVLMTHTDRPKRKLDDILWWLMEGEFFPHLKNFEIHQDGKDERIHFSTDTIEVIQKSCPRLSSVVVYDSKVYLRFLKKVGMRQFHFPCLNSVYQEGIVNTWLGGVNRQQLFNREDFARVVLNIDLSQIRKVTITTSLNTNVQFLPCLFPNLTEVDINLDPSSNRFYRLNIHTPNQIRKLKIQLVTHRHLEMDPVVSLLNDFTVLEELEMSANCIAYGWKELALMLEQHKTLQRIRVLLYLFHHTFIEVYSQTPARYGTDLSKFYKIILRSSLDVELLEVPYFLTRRYAIHGNEFPMEYDPKYTIQLRKRGKRFIRTRVQHYDSRNIIQFHESVISAPFIYSVEQNGIEHSKNLEEASIFRGFMTVYIWKRILRHCLGPYKNIRVSYPQYPTEHDLERKMKKEGYIRTQHYMDDDSVTQSFQK